jgi:uncharacterized protein (TIRG00374 family)
MLHYAALLHGRLHDSVVTDTSAPSRPLRRFLAPLIKIGVSAALLWVLLSNVDGARLWALTRTASPVWLGAALGVYFSMYVISAWRWRVLLETQHARVPFTKLVASFLVGSFFNNFLPSNIGGDVVRISDTAPATGSKTVATTVVLVDRGLGLLGLIFVAALGASTTAGGRGAMQFVGPGVLWSVLAGGLILTATVVMQPASIGWFARPLEVLHRDWVRERAQRLMDALTRFRRTPGALVLCFAGGILVQALLVVFYVAVARGLAIPIATAHLAVLIPLSFIVQMAPVSVNGLGLREATFTLYFARLGLPAEPALALSLVGAALILLFSVSGALLYLLRRRSGIA